MEERIKKLRKTLGLTLEKFGKRLGVTKQTISRIENGINSITEQMQKSICREFNVNPLWLETGEGDMFTQTDVAFSAQIDRILADEDDSRRNFIKSLLYASDEDIAALGRIIEYYIQLEKNSPKTSDTHPL